MSLFVGQNNLKRNQVRDFKELEFEVPVVNGQKPTIFSWRDVKTVSIEGIKDIRGKAEAMRDFPIK